MFISTARLAVLSGMSSLLLCTAPSHADFILVDNFESLSATNLEGQNGWTNASGVNAGSIAVTSDPAGGSNQVAVSLARDGSGSDDHALAKSLSTPIAEGTTGTLFLRLRHETTSNLRLDTIAGLTQDNASSANTSTSAYANYIVSTDIGETDADAGGDMSVYNSNLNQDVANTAADNWYSVWIVFDNADDDVDVYLKLDDGSGATLSDLVADDFGFRNTADTALQAFKFRNNEDGHTTNAYFDDIYIDATGVNLANPIPEPASFLLVAAGALGVLPRRRR